MPDITPELAELRRSAGRKGRLVQELLYGPDERRAQTQAARDAKARADEDLVDPDRVLSDEERARKVAALRELRKVEKDLLAAQERHSAVVIRRRLLQAAELQAQLAAEPLSA